MINVLVTDGENRATLAVTRSLGRKGCRVVVTGKDRRTLASRSRFCDRGYVVPDPFLADQAYVDALSDIIQRENIHILLPMTEQSIYRLNPRRSMLPNGVVLACPREDIVEQIADKAALFQRAERLGIAVPRTWYLKDPKDLEQSMTEIPHFPVVVKPAMSRIRVGERFIAGGVSYAESPIELERLYRTKEALRYPSMIQERIIGDGTGLFTLYDRDHHVALFSHRRLREKPPSGGVSVVCESVPLDTEMVEAADRLLASVQWQGVAMVEFKRDNRDGRAKLMEINGRFWGSLQLAITCGVDFPAILLDQLQGCLDEKLLEGYRLGHRMKWFYGTLDHLLIRLKHSDIALKLPPRAPSRSRVLLDFLKLWEPNSSYDVLNLADMGPFWHESRCYIRDTFRGGT